MKKRLPFSIFLLTLTFIFHPSISLAQSEFNITPSTLFINWTYSEGIEGVKVIEGIGGIGGVKESGPLHIFL